MAPFSQSNFLARISAAYQKTTDQKGSSNSEAIVADGKAKPWLQRQGGVQPGNGAIRT
jgi:hypothetical protein